MCERESGEGVKCGVVLGIVFEYFMFVIDGTREMMFLLYK